MAPKELVSRYKRYKQGTRNIIYWLTQTAAACGNLRDVVTSLPEGGNGTRKLEGRAAAAAAAQQETAYEIRSHELVELARGITRAAPPVEIPEGILLIMQDVIDGRMDCAVWYESQAGDGVGGDRTDRGGHRAFITTLEEILKLLRTAQGSQPTKSKGKASKRKVGALGSAFDGLKLEEPGENALGDAPTVVLKGATHDSVRIRIKLEKQADGAIFESWCLLRDLADVRKYVQQTWHDYSKGALSFLTAGSITATAMGLLRCAEEDFRKASPNIHTSWESLVRLLGLAQFSRGHAVWMCPIAETGNKTAAVAKDASSILELLCPVAFYCLQDFQAEATIWCRYNEPPPSSTRASKPLHPFCKVLHRVTDVIETLAHPSDELNLPEPPDEFVAGLVEIHSSKRVPVWMVFACQICIDIHDALGDHVDVGFRTLARHFDDVEELEAKLNGYVDASQAGLKHCVCDMQDARAEFRPQIKGAKAWDELYGKVRNGELSERWKRSLDRVFPGLSAQGLSEMKVQQYSAGIEFARHGVFVLSIAHVYQALRACGVLESPWQDMEFILSQFGSKQLLVAKQGPAYDGMTAQKRYMLDIGLGIQDVQGGQGGAPHAFTRHSSSVCRAKKSPKNIVITSPLVEALLERSRRDSGHFLGRRQTELLNDVLRGLAADEATAASKGLRAISHLRETFTAKDLLETLRQELTRAEPALNFDYASFMLSCAQLMEDIAESIAEDPEEVRRRSEKRHFRTVYGILANCGQNAQSKTVGEVLRAHIEAHGKTYVKKANNQSSSHIPKGLRPDIRPMDPAQQAAIGSLQAELDAAGVTYSFSGTAMAAHHHDFKMEMKTARHGVDEDKCRILYGPTFSEPMLVAFGDTLDAIPGAAFKAKRAELELHIAAFESGDITREQLRKHALHTAGHKVVQLTTQDDPDDPSTVHTQWVLQITPGSPRFATLLDAVEVISGLFGRALLEGHWVPLPVDMWPQDLDTEPTAAQQRNMARCVRAVRAELYAREPEACKARALAAMSDTLQRELQAGDMRGLAEFFGR